MDNIEATASLCLCLWPRLSECGSIDEVLLNIKMRAQIKGTITGAGRSRHELVEQANNMFWRLMNSMCNPENVAIDRIQKHLFSVGKNICWHKVTIMALLEMDWILLRSISTQNSIEYNR